MISSFISAQNPFQVKLDEGKIIEEKPLVKNWINGNEYSEATLTIYPAKNPNGQAIIACPGGGYAGIATAHEGHDMASWFNSLGVTYAVLHYRMPNGNPKIPLNDVHQAILYLRKNAKKWNLRQLGIMGSSAGGHLASTAATHFTEETHLDFQILLYPVVTMSDYTHKGSKVNLLGDNPNDKDIRLYSNELQVSKQTPPAFIIHSSNDQVVPVLNSINYYLALCKYNIPVAMHLYPIGGHGWGYNDSFPYKSQWKDELKKWLNEILQP